MSKNPYEKLSRLKRDYPNVFGNIRFNMDGGTLVKKGFRFIGLEEMLLLRSFIDVEKGVTLVYKKILKGPPGSGYKSRYEISDVTYFTLK